VTLTKVQAQELAWGGDVPGLEVVAEVGLGARRWSETMRVVFRSTETPDAELWAFNWERALTEHQENEYPDTPRPYRVRPVAVTRITYEVVK
jgi:hypothetical protein